MCFAASENNNTALDTPSFCFIQDEEEIIVPTDPATGAIDFIECESPLDLVMYILSREKNKGMLVDKLGQEILKQTGTSWNKRFKNRHGTMPKVSRERVGGVL